MTTEEILRSAAAILRHRSKKPNGILLNVLCRVLNDTADKERIERLDSVARGEYQFEPDWSLIDPR